MTEQGRADRRLIKVVDAALGGSEAALAMWKIMRKAVAEERDFTLQEHQALELAYERLEEELSGVVLVDLFNVG